MPGYTFGFPDPYTEKLASHQYNLTNSDLPGKSYSTAFISTADSNVITTV